MIDATNPPFLHILMVLDWILIQWLAKPVKDIELLMFIKQFEMTMLEVGIRRCVYGHNEMYMISNYTYLHCGM